MAINKLLERPDLIEDEKLLNAYTQFDLYLDELNSIELHDFFIATINEEVDQLNAIPASGPQLKKQLKKSQKKVVDLIVKELKVVPFNYYKHYWQGVGIAIFGFPIGMAISGGSYFLMALGFPIGQILGALIGAYYDQRAAMEGKQLHTELKEESVYW